MRCHANARLSPIGRRLLVDRIERDGWTVGRAAESAGISERTARKWLARFRAEGAVGLRDRSSAPRTVANRTDERTVEAICALRRLRFSAPELAELLQLPCSTVSAVLKRCGLGKLGRLGLQPAERYERGSRADAASASGQHVAEIQGANRQRFRSRSPNLKQGVRGGRGAASPGGPRRPERECAAGTTGSAAWATAEPWRSPWHEAGERPRSAVFVSRARFAAAVDQTLGRDREREIANLTGVSSAAFEAATSSTCRPPTRRSPTACGACYGGLDARRAHRLGHR
jgi:transposase